MIAPIQSLAQLRSKAGRDEKYRRLAVLTAENLGGNPEDNLDQAMRFLLIECQETSEEEVIEEVNGCRSLL